MVFNFLCLVVFVFECFFNFVDNFKFNCGVDKGELKLKLVVILVLKDIGGGIGDFFFGERME